VSLGVRKKKENPPQGGKARVEKTGPNKKGGAGTPAREGKFKKEKREGKKNHRRNKEGKKRD